MKRYYDIFIDFAIDTECDTYEMSFEKEWRPTEMLDYMCDKFSIDQDSIVETRCTYVKRYHLSKND